MEGAEDELAPCSEELYVVDETLDPVQAILKYSRTDLLAQQLAYIKGISAAAAGASSSELTELLQLVQELWADGEGDVQLEAVKQLPGLGLALRGDCEALDQLLLLAVDAVQRFVHEGQEEGTEASITALEALLPLLPARKAWSCLRQLLQPLLPAHPQEQRQGPTAEECGGLLEVLLRCTSRLLRHGTRAGPQHQQLQPLQEPKGLNPPEAAPETAAGECSHEQLQAAAAPEEEPLVSLVEQAIEACATNEDYAVQEAIASRLPLLLPLLPPPLAAALAPRLADQLSLNANWKVRQAVAASVPGLIFALDPMQLSPQGQQGSDGEGEGRGLGCEGAEWEEEAALSQHRLAALLTGRLSGDGSQWVRAAAQCAAGPALRCMPRGWPAAAGGAEGEAAGGQLALALCLLKMFVEAALAPRQPPAPKLVELASSLGGVARRVLPSGLVAVEESKLLEVFRTLLGSKEVAVAAAAVAAAPDLAAALVAAGGHGASAAADVLVPELLAAAVARGEALGEALAVVLLPLAQALPPGPGRGRLLQLLPLLRDHGGAEGRDAPALETVCGNWRVRWAVASQLAGLGRCLVEGDGGEAQAEALAACVRRLLSDPVWRVRQEAAKQLEQLPPGISGRVVSATDL